MLFYEFRYTHDLYGDLPILFRLIFGFLTDHNATFYAFKLFYALFALGTIYFIYSKYNQYVALAYAFAFIFPLGSFNGQIRNGISVVIVLFAILYLIKSNSKYSYANYFILILIASLIHKSSLFFLLVILAKIKFKREQYIAATLMAVIFIFIAYPTGLLYSVASLVTNDYRVLQWLEPVRKNGMRYVLILTAEELAGIFLTHLSKRIISSTGDISNDDSKKNISVLTAHESDIILKINYLLLPLIPLYNITNAFFRLYKYVMIINYIPICQAIYTGKRKRYLLILVLAYCIVSRAILIYIDTWAAVLPVYHSFDIHNLQKIFTN